MTGRNERLVFLCIYKQKTWFGLSSNQTKFRLVGIKCKIINIMILRLIKQETEIHLFLYGERRIYCQKNGKVGATFSRLCHQNIRPNFIRLSLKKKSCRFSVNVPWS